MKGDDFNIIYERNYRRSFLFTKSYVHDDMVAEDIVAESLVKYWRLVSAGENEITDFDIEDWQKLWQDFAAEFDKQVFTES